MARRSASTLNYDTAEHEEIRLLTADEDHASIRLFCTHEGSGMGHSEVDIQKACPGAKVTKGLAIYGSSVKVEQSIIKN